MLLSAPIFREGAGIASKGGGTSRPIAAIGSPVDGEPPHLPLEVVISVTTLTSGANSTNLSLYSAASSSWSPRGAARPAPRVVSRRRFSSRANQRHPQATWHHLSLLQTRHQGHVARILPMTRVLSANTDSLACGGGDGVAATRRCEGGCGRVGRDADAQRRHRGPLAHIPLRIAV